MTSENIYTRLAKARAEFNQKGDFKKVKGEGLKFAYLPIEAAKPVIEETTSKYGVTILPISYDIIEDWTYTYEKTSKYDGTKTKWLYQTADVTFRLAGPEDYLDLVIRAEAQDNSDKCINKVYTMAYKNLVKIVFGFAESSKDDGDATQEEVPAVKPEPKRARKVNPEDPFFGNAEKETAETKNLNYAEHCRKVLSKWVTETDVNGIPDWVMDYFKANGPLKTMAPGLVIRLHSEMKAQCIKLPEVE